MREAEELSVPTELYYAQPLEENIFEWHFTIRGPSDSDFDGGLYHGRILLPHEYPMKPPSIILLTVFICSHFSYNFIQNNFYLLKKIRIMVGSK